MTYKYMVQKSIEHVKKNGFNFSMIEGTLIDYSFKYLENNNRYFWVGDNDCQESVMIYELIYNHDFCKAFFGEENTCKDCGTSFRWSSTVKTMVRYCEECLIETYIIPMWQYHLTKMVLEKEPLRYLEKHLDK
ncbi:MAG: hypothetical protein GWP19_03910 [Planctomycetia bacterium]|nr:hypothetical protein [Planctomycetia bacterium]